MLVCDLVGLDVMQCGFLWWVVVFGLSVMLACARCVGFLGRLGLGCYIVLCGLARF